MLHLHFYRFSDREERPFIKLSYLCPQTEQETSTTEWLSRYEDYEEVFPSLVSHMESKLGCSIELLTNHQDLKPEYLSTLRLYSPRLIIYRVGDQTLDYYGQLKATAGVEAEALLNVIDEVITKLIASYPGTTLYSDEAVSFITDELEPYLEPIDLTQINFPFVNG
nr:hypothetical protein [Vibrio sp. 04Ya108]